MKRWIFIILVLAVLVRPVYADSFTAPDAPEIAQQYMPDTEETFSQGLWHIVTSALSDLQPAFMQAAKVNLSLMAVCMLLCVVSKFSGASQKIIGLVGITAISIIIFRSAGSAIHLGIDTVTQVCDYTKLLFPVLAAATAAQGATASSASIYTATAMLTSVLSTTLTKLTVPLIYIYMIICVADGIGVEHPFKGLKNLTKWASTWSVKLVLYFFTGYLTISGVVSGSVDAATMKAAKLTISGSVPVVGSIISDATEAIIVSAGVMKSAAGIYGLWVVLAICIGPFLQIGVQYLFLKLTAAVSNVFADKPLGDLLQDFTGVMGLILGMTGAACLLLLISIVCFIRSVA